MQETAEQYVSRLLSYSEGQDPLSTLGNTPERLRQLVTTTTPEQWTSKPSPDRWSAGQVLAHLADGEIVVGWRVRSILASDGVSIQAYDQNAWASAFAYERVDVQESLATFTAVRGSLLSLVRRVEPARLKHHGTHAERGIESIHHILRLIAGHDLNHLMQIERLVS